MGDLSKHFNRSEFACKCGCGFDTVDAKLIEYLENIRLAFNSPITINSGCRCEIYNKSIGGSENSWHIEGRAADIVVKNANPHTVTDYCEDEKAFIGGLGRYDTFTHIDSRGYKARW